MAFTQADLNNFREKALIVGTPTFIGKALGVNFNVIGSTPIPLTVGSPVRLVGVLLKNIVGVPNTFAADIYSATNAGGVLMFKDLENVFSYNGSPESSTFTNINGAYANTRTAYVHVSKLNGPSECKADVYLFGIYQPI